MNNGNSFGHSQQPQISVTAPMLQQQQSASIISSPSISSLPTLSPATIVRAVFSPPDQLQRPQLQPQQFVNMFPMHQIHHQNPNPEIMAELDSAAKLQSGSSTAGAGGRSQQPKNKGQAKPKQSKPPAKKTQKQPTQQPQAPKPPTSQHSTQAGGRLTKKQQEKEEYYNRKYQLLRKCIRSLVFKNAALCDEVARLHQRIATVDDERKTLAKRLIHHERLKVRRKQTAESRKAQQQAAAAAVAASMATSLTTSTAPVILSPAAISNSVFAQREIELR